jgi:hypothetical protein
MSVLNVASTAIAMVKISTSPRRLIALAITKPSVSIWTMAIAMTTIVAITALASTRNVKTASMSRRKKMPAKQVTIGDMLILRSGLQNIVEDTQNLLAKRKHARMLMQILDELLERREKESEGAIAEEQIRQMVNRFLQWKLPDTFNPDGGISFNRTFNEHTAHAMTREPVGTNLFDATQAEAMIRYLIEGIND